MLDYLGEKEASDRRIKSIERTLSDKKSRTKDLHGIIHYQRLRRCSFRKFIIGVTLLQGAPDSC